MTRNRDIPSLSAEAAALARSLLIHEDAAVLAFNKPSGMASQGGGGVGQSLDDLLWAFAKSNGKRPRLVHRLDLGTSGVIIAARTQPAAAFLSAAFAGRDTQKTYLALVKGKIPQAEHGVIDAALVKVEEGGRPRMILAREGRKGAQSARTGWKILARNGDQALMQLSPETGRMHQIRVHLMSLGCPILGDGLYGEGQATGARVMLHAARLEVPHPEGGTLALEAPVPDDFRQAAARAGVQAGL
ncbi:pseudouridine synthase family protein [Hyphomonas polymorpha PS728]|uniref:Pseudouridine synthase family protein n=1 Tax=Hyphomonas polymorpha PS728 TaxID=1280954 RepID=A0A062V728_9PROT|nr:RluA family pseudouridine synthase [Hyphomonas polymorpha]KCZ97852.1 pseudouridine synthase family protein [Hyphomonas polymorpha PS728]